MTCRGCTRSCVTCGGSAYTFKKFLNRDSSAFRSPQIIARDIQEIQKHLKAPIFILGDIRQDREEYADEMLNTLKKMQIKNQIAFEFFTPPPQDFFEKVHRSLSHYSIEISLESHNESIRKGFGKKYSNKEVEESLKSALRYGCERIDVYFMTGIPHQTSKSVLETVDYCEHLYQVLGGTKKLRVFISPMAPFLDPGSMVYENHKKFGYKLLCKTLEEHRQALTKPTWKYILNYENKWITKDEQVESTYSAALGLNKIKAKYKVISPQDASMMEKRILKAGEIIKKIDDGYSPESLKKDNFSVSTICKKDELEWKTPLLPVNYLRIFQTILSIDAPLTLFRGSFLVFLSLFVLSMKKLRNFLTNGKLKCKFFIYKKYKKEYE